MIAASPFVRIQIELGSAAYDDCTASAIRKRMKTRELTGGSFAIFANSRRLGEFRFRSVARTQTIRLHLPFCACSLPTFENSGLAGRCKAGFFRRTAAAGRAAVSELEMKNADVPCAYRCFAVALTNYRRFRLLLKGCGRTHRAHITQVI